MKQIFLVNLSTNWLVLKFKTGFIQINHFFLLWWISNHWKVVDVNFGSTFLWWFVWVSFQIYLFAIIFGRVHSMIEKLAQFTDIRCCLIVGGLSTKVRLLFQFHDSLISEMFWWARIELCVYCDAFSIMFRFSPWAISSTAFCLLYSFNVLWSITTFLSVWHAIINSWVSTDGFSFLLTIAYYANINLTSLTIAYYLVSILVDDMNYCNKAFCRKLMFFPWLTG